MTSQEFHDKCMSVEINRFGNWESSVIQGLHVSVFLYETCNMKRRRSNFAPQNILATSLKETLEAQTNLDGRKSGEIQPRCFVSVFVIVSLVLQLPEGRSPQAMKLQTQLFLFLIGNNVHI